MEWTWRRQGNKHQSTEVKAINFRVLQHVVTNIVHMNLLSTSYIARREEVKGSP